MNDTDELIAALARVEPGHQGADPSGAGARTLLAGITTRKPRRRRFTLALAGMATAVGAGLFQIGTPSYAVTKDADGVVWVSVHDFGDVSRLRDDLMSLGVSAMVDHVPAGHWCQEPRGEIVYDVPPGLYTLPEGDGPGWRMRIDGTLLEKDQTIVYTIGADGGAGTLVYRGPVAPCRVVSGSPFREVTSEEEEPFRFVDLDVGGQTVGEVLPRLPGGKVGFMPISVPPGSPGGWGEGPVIEKADAGWYVWAAVRFRDDPGRLVLLVTEEKFGRNPVTGR
uniref:hypothetical protein n=1 Tax=Herbidospora sakaeratensis TaxID=564415 RepID=UPI00078393EF|nr:hypothetical protein [Herbidospora sakaeratensis]